MTHSPLLRTLSVVALLSAASVLRADVLAVPGVEPGPHPVGLRVIQTFDASRPGFAGSEKSARPMQVVVWYPAAAAGEAPMSLRDYVDLCATELTFAAPSEAERDRCRAEFGATLQELGVGDSERAALLERPTRAFRDAPPAAGSWPVVLFAHVRPSTANLMSELLASHGFVVAAVATKGSFRAEYKLSLTDVAGMTADLGFVLATARQLPFAGAGKVGAIGMSNGALAALLLHLRNPDVAAIVSLDGTLGEQAAQRVIPADPYFAPERVRAQILHLYAPKNDYLDFSTLESWKEASRVLVSYPALVHLDFLAYAVYARAPESVAAKSFGSVCRQTLDFLRATLAGKRWQVPADDPGIFTVRALGIGE